MLRVAPLLLLASLAACSEDPAPPAAPPRDPLIEQALNDPLMTDPDLSANNEAAAALTVRVDGPLPVLPATPEEVAAARAEAALLVGGADKLRAPPAASGKVAPLREPHDPSDHLAMLRDKTGCRATLSNSAIWAARLPAAMPVYPRGATQAATGGEGSGCRVMAVVFTTPVPQADVLAFYWHQAKEARLAPRRLQAGGEDVLQGQGAGTAFDLRTRTAGDQTVVELAVVSG